MGLFHVKTERLSRESYCVQGLKIDLTSLICNLYKIFGIPQILNDDVDLPGG